MKKLLAAVLVLWLFCASALGDSLVTNGGVSLDESALPDNTEDPSVNLSIKSRQGKRIAKRSPVRSCTELGFCNPEQHEGADC